ncbi:DUF5915 domain-containing protein [Fischerella thermalis]|uniref:DUF5915 domain-containing protein n=2 Tax=Fischerella thermalis TaxID=372787 RepID=UPI00241C621F|nr:DUF5915 domain-containing protein [Fischerella thermalis]
MSKVNVLIRDVTERLEAYDPTTASRAIRDFVVNDLSNWYVRRNRRRFWKSENDGDKLMAPMAPFVSEHIYQNLVLSVFPEQPESVHLANWEKFDATLIDTNLLRDMETLIRIVELGRAARATAKVKIRQPLGEILVQVRNQAEIAGLKRLEEQLKEELNVKKVTYLDIATDFVDYTIKPNLPLVGKRLGKQVPALKKKLQTIDTREIVHNIREGKETVIHLDGKSYHLEPEAFLIEVNSLEGYAAIEEYGYLAALNTQLTSELIQEGVVREAIRLLQEIRKKAGLNLSDRIHLGLETSGTLLEALKAHPKIVKNEVLAQDIRFAQIKEACYNTCVNINDIQLRVTLQKISSNGEVD